MTLETLNPAAGGTANGVRKASREARRSEHTTGRARLETAIERALTYLDALDGDPDLEPALSGVTCSTTGNDRDLEAQCDDEGFECDREPEAGI